jgi:hypothetical protein
MLNPEDLAQAAQLFEKLREIVRPAPPEFVKDGADLAALLRCARTQAWIVTKRPDFAAAAPPMVLGPRITLRRRDQVLAWLAGQTKESPGPRGPGRVRHLT